MHRKSPPCSSSQPRPTRPSVGIVSVLESRTEWLDSLPTHGLQSGTPRPFRRFVEDPACGRPPCMLPTMSCSRRILCPFGVAWRSLLSSPSVPTLGGTVEWFGSRNVGPIFSRPLDTANIPQGSGCPFPPSHPPLGHRMHLRHEFSAPIVSRWYRVTRVSP